MRGKEENVKHWQTLNVLLHIREAGRLEVSTVIIVTVKTTRRAAPAISSIFIYQDVTVLTFLYINCTTVFGESLSLSLTTSREP